ncbi:YhdP family protein [Glaciecola petra]|uniref:YhdP family protein n=1 Tax=Glaciecola petra TaxID=3075602 RepID=A0ABU2ZVM1_9ALTE|nr:YhdP family protein [Aestuariibacter sp. P117]MDT0595639.1 YhdP family protein [Aestuariibacter sp. P117]
MSQESTIVNKQKLEIKEASKSSRLAAYVLKKLWTLFALVLVVIALFMSLLRYSLPYLDNHKDYLQQYISDEYAVDLNIGELSANWTSTGPSIILREVSIEKGLQSPIDLQIGELFLDIDFWSSIASRRLQSNKVVLNSLVVDLNINQLNTNESEFPIIEALETLFLAQLSNFSVINSRVILTTNQTSKAIDIEQLSWLNKENRHQGVGVFALEDFSENTTKFILDLYGDVSSYKGTLYAKAQDINLSAWFNEYTNLESKLASSKGNFELWAKINNSAIESVTGNILPSSFDWTAQSIALQNTIEGKFALEKIKQQWEFVVQDLIIETEGESLKTSLTGAYSYNNGVKLVLDNKLELSSLLPVTALFSLSAADALAMNNTQIILDSFSAQLSVQNQWIKAKFTDISWSENQLVPGVSELNADLYWANDNGKLLISGENNTLSTESLFDRNMLIDNLYLPIHINLKNQGQVAINNATAVIDSIPININSEYNFDKRLLSLLVNVEPIELARVPSLLPNHLMGADAKDFLTAAFMGGGQINKADILWHGKIDDFPFTENEGVFQSKVDISEADFSFSETWPALNKLDIELLFENLALNMRSPSSLLGKVKLRDLQAEIPNLTQNSMLSIQAKGAAKSSQLTELMLQSSLSDSLGKLLNESVKIEGELTTDLNLYIPLSSSQDTRAVGKVFLTYNTVNLPALNLQLKNAVGQVSFDNESITIDKLSTTLFEQLVSVDLKGEQLTDFYALGIEVQGDSNTYELASNVSESFGEYFNGNAQWTLAADFELGKNSFSYEASLFSDLINVNANLPQPLAFFSGQETPLLIHASGNNIASSIDIQLADIAQFDGALPHKEKQFNRAHLAIGPTEFETRGVGFSISADFEKISADGWYNFIAALTQNIDSSRPAILGRPQRIFVDTEKLAIQGQELTDVDLRVKRLADQWNFELSADQVRANAILHDEWFSKGVSIDAEYVKLDAINDTETVISDGKNNTVTGVKIDPKSLPNLNITCKSCEIAGVNLGRVEIEAEPNNDGLKIAQLLLDNGQGTVNASGQWYKRNEDHYTFLAGDLNSSDFGEFLKQLGFDSGIQDSQADMAFALTWKDSPFDAQFEHLDGEIDWRLSDGYLTEVSDKGSRIFTLLSLNSLVRKLSLDFRDVFAKGFFYDSMRGSVQITEGKADTRDTFIDGAAGEIEIYGYTDLAASELNYNVSFTPNVTGNLPVLVYFFTVSPPSALAALAIDQVLTSAKVISNINYSVTGTIESPILIETGRESTEVDLPARRQNEQELFPSDSLEFVPPTKEDFIHIEKIDDQSD